MLVRYTEEDILGCLSATTWVRTCDIFEMLRAGKPGEDETWLERVLREPSYGWLYMTLLKLRDEGRIEEREGEDSEVLATLKGYGYYEYRLKEPTC